MKITIQPTDQTGLSHAVGSALNVAFQDIKQDEPQLIANLAWELPLHINAIKMTGPSTITAGSVFVHARPLVHSDTFPDKEKYSVEIGDVLFIRTLVTKGEIKERRALLYQAKKPPSIPTTPDNENQWHLYANWPEFKYAPRCGSLTDQVRHITEQDMYDAAKYMLIGIPYQRCLGLRGFLELGDSTLNFQECISNAQRLSGLSQTPCCNFTAKPTKPKISDYHCLHHELVDFITGHTGKTFSTPEPDDIGWNRVINDLISETAKMRTVYMQRAAVSPRSRGKQSRGSGGLPVFNIKSNYSIFSEVTYTALSEKKRIRSSSLFWLNSSAEK